MQVVLQNGIKYICEENGKNFRNNMKKNSQSDEIRFMT
jgi:hypothetical protein